MAGGVVRALGMYWDRRLVVWDRHPRIFGRQQRGADPVDFAGQRGVYLLHDGREVTYAGRVTEPRLGDRLFEHTEDRHAGRWDRFSWFGLLDVGDDGRLEDRERVAGADAIIAALEAVLIETLEPPGNRRRGDNLQAVEYLQAKDPEKLRRERADVIADLQDWVAGR